MDYLLVLIGGAMGACSRYAIGHYISKKSKNVIIGTFFINIAGAFLLGIISGLNPTHSLLIFIADGFLAAFTTFSTFMFEGFNLFRAKKILNGVFYIVVTFVLGVVGFWLGYIVSTGGVNL